MIKFITACISDAITFMWLLVLVGSGRTDPADNELEMLDGIEEEIK